MGITVKIIVSMSEEISPEELLSQQRKLDDDLMRELTKGNRERDLSPSWSEKEETMNYGDIRAGWEETVAQYGGVANIPSNELRLWRRERDKLLTRAVRDGLMKRVDDALVTIAEGPSSCQEKLEKYNLIERSDSGSFWERREKEILEKHPEYRGLLGDFVHWRVNSILAEFCRRSGEVHKADSYEFENRQSLWGLSADESVIVGKIRSTNLPEPSSMIQKPAEKVQVEQAEQKEEEPWIGVFDALKAAIEASVTAPGVVGYLFNQAEKEALPAGKMREIIRLAEEFMVLLPIETSHFWKIELLTKPELQARRCLTAACDFKRRMGENGEFVPNHYLENLNPAVLNALLEKKGVREALTLDNMIIFRRLDIKKFFDLADSSKITIFTSIQDREGYKNYREAFASWLVNNRNLDQNEAYDAFDIARGLDYIANTAECSWQGKYLLERTGESRTHNSVFSRLAHFKDGVRLYLNKMCGEVREGDIEFIPDILLKDDLFGDEMRGIFLENFENLMAEKKFLGFRFDRSREDYVLAYQRKKIDPAVVLYKVFTGREEANAGDIYRILMDNFGYKRREVQKILTHLSKLKNKLRI